MRCLHCQADFPLNNELASLPEGHRIAFDETHQRVWRICSSCEEWNLLGRESALAALPELRARFDAGKVQSFPEIALAEVGEELELIALGSEKHLPDPTLATPGRNDLAREERRQSIEKRRGVVVSGLVLSLLVAILSKGFLFIDRPLGVQEVQKLIGALLVTYLLAFVMHPARKEVGFFPLGPFRPKLGATSREKWKHYERTIETFLSLTMIAFLAPEIRIVHAIVTTALWLTWSIAMVLVLAWLRSLASRTVWRNGLFIGGFFLLASLLLILAGRISLGHLGLGTGVVVAVFGVASLLSHRLRNKVHANVTLNKKSPADGSAVRLAWSDSRQELQVFESESAHPVTGAHANQLLREVLKNLHHRDPPTTAQIRTANDIVRVSGGLSGVLAAIASQVTDASNGIALKSLPVTYQAALDLALATSDTRRVEAELHRQRATEAVAVAVQAETLDRQLLAPDTT